MQFRNAPLVAIVILVLITPLVCSGASYAHMDIGELWRESDTIIIGTVTSITSEGGGYYSVDVEVERYVKSPSEASSLVIHYHVRTNFEMVTPEGTIVSSDNSEPLWGFNDGESVYVFLRRVTPDYYSVVRGFQGKYSIIDGVAMNSIGRRMSIPAPFSPIIWVEAGIGVVIFVTIWMKRDWLSERISGAIVG